jgi:hypothetical protein
VKVEKNNSSTDFDKIKCVFRKGNQADVKFDLKSKWMWYCVNVVKVNSQREL